MLRVMWQVLTNQSASFQSKIITLTCNFIYEFASFDRNVEYVCAF